MTNAQIPRGSFYQYFEDKEDAIKYIIQKFILAEEELIGKILINTNGDIFESAIKMYDYMVEELLKDNSFKLVRNILQELKKENFNIFDKNNKLGNKSQLNNLINKETLNLDNEEDLYYIMKIITIMTRTEAIEVISKKETKDQGTEDLKRELEILKRGMKK
ncbi:MAG: TetR/AcrR family transcriptional regulator [Clostridia bacterium]|nr:TetR/AcrR family transcriptional regulator [Clostridia bacterium]